MDLLQKIRNLFSSSKQTNPNIAVPTLGNTLKLIPGQQYRVTKEFTDYDKIIHPAGETWIYLGTNFLPYEDGLTIFLSTNSKTISYRLQWRKEEQADIIDNFHQFVEVC